MPKITIDGQEIECRDGIPVLQAALEAGLEVPHYCYHPGLSVVASCRLCLMEMKLPHPQTKELGWVPKLFPSCQTPVRDGMEVRFASEGVENNQKRVMEYYLLNHPLDCPVCDKAGECSLQDYTEEFGPSTSRMVEDKYKNPKKDIGSQTLLYSDRCVLCTRCVRFTNEISGSSELIVANRGHRGEIDVFPGEPLENPLQGNVVDLCPVGALLDKDFLFQQRVWRLKSAKSIAPTDAGGQSIWIDHNDGRIFRIRPRFNEKTNAWWISDEVRKGWAYVHSHERLSTPLQRVDNQVKQVRWEDLSRLLTDGLAQASQGNDGASVAAVLSPMMACEEAWLLASFVRSVAPQATLSVGWVPTEGEDQTFPQGRALQDGTIQGGAIQGGAGVSPATRFTIRAEKCPNRRGIETLIEQMGGPTATFGDFLAQANRGKFVGVYLYGGYPKPWITDDIAAAFERVEFLVRHDLFAAPLDETKTSLRIPAAVWAEREGTFMNIDGLLQPFERAIPPREGVKFDGQFFAELMQEPGLFKAAKIREKMAASLPALGEVFEPRPEPKYAH